MIITVLTNTMSVQQKTVLQGEIDKAIMIRGTRKLHLPKFLD